MEVYVVVEHDWEDDNVVAVFSDEQAAEDVANGLLNSSVEKFTLDAEVEE